MSAHSPVIHHVCFVKADTRSWEDQMGIFEAAMAKSPHQSVDIVIANAGMDRGKGDPIMQLDDPSSPPTKPSMHIIDINLIGAIYTFKLAICYFRKCPQAESRDRCFIFIGGVAGIVDNLGSWEYSTAKFGLRGLMRAARWQSYHQDIRIAHVALAWVRTVIQSPAVYENMLAKGIEIASVDSAVAAIMRISCDRSINGHSFVIFVRSIAPEGFKDAAEDDWKDQEYWLQKFQRAVYTLCGDDWQ